MSKNLGENIQTSQKTDAAKHCNCTILDVENALAKFTWAKTAQKRIEQLKAEGKPMPKNLGEIQKLMGSSPLDVARSSMAKSGQISRNAPCPCGSKKLYKRSLLNYGMRVLTEYMEHLSGTHFPFASCVLQNIQTSQKTDAAKHCNCTILDVENALAKFTWAKNALKRIEQLKPEGEPMPKNFGEIQKLMGSLPLDVARTSMAKSAQISRNAHVALRSFMKGAVGRTKAVESPKAIITYMGKLRPFEESFKAAENSTFHSICHKFKFRDEPFLVMWPL